MVKNSMSRDGFTKYLEICDITFFCVEIVLVSYLVFKSTLFQSC